MLETTIPPLLPLAFYLCLCAFIGRLGRYRSIGFAGFFFLSLIISPLVTGIILLLSQDRRDLA